MIKGWQKRTRVFITEAANGRDVVPHVLAEATVVDVAHVDVLYLLHVEVFVEAEIVEGDLEQTIYPAKQPTVVYFWEHREFGQLVGGDPRGFLVFVITVERKGEETDAWTGGGDGDVWKGGSAWVAEDTSRRERSGVGIVWTWCDEGKVAHVLLALRARQCLVLRLAFAR